MKAPLRLLSFSLGLLVTSLHAGSSVSSGSAPSVLSPATQALPFEALAKEQHPRLLAPQEAWNQLAAHRRADPELDRFCKALVVEATRVLKRPPLERHLTGRRLLAVSRDLIHRVLLCSFAWRTTGDRRFLDKAREDLQSVADFSDWNPSHFLDVAEMSAGVALGYDWLYQDLSIPERAALREALVSKGLNLVRNGHSTFRNTNNWSQVCTGGLCLAALALADEEPALCASVLHHARVDLHNGLQAYAPDGVYPEGPGYWSYGTQYTVLLLAALQDTLHDDWGMLATPGLLNSARFYAHATAPSGLCFDFADASPHASLAPALWYLAGKLGAPELVQGQRRFLSNGRGGTDNDRFAPLVAFWWPKTTAQAPEPTCFIGQGENPVVLWRSSWTDPKAFYFAIKAGGSGVSHGHMDAGSFVLEWHGLRWAEDLGMQDYESLESKGVRLWDRQQESDRWKVFRIGPFSHNTLTFDHQLHQAAGLAKLVSGNDHSVLIDLSPVFLPGQAGKVLRRVTRLPEHLIINDSGEETRPGSKLRWAMTTRAAVTLAGEGKVLLQQGTEHLELHLKSSAGVITLKTQDLSQGPAPTDAPNPGMTQIQGELIVPASGRWEIEAVFDCTSS